MRAQVGGLRGGGLGELATAERGRGASNPCPRAHAATASRLAPLQPPPCPPASLAWRCKCRGLPSHTTAARPWSGCSTARGSRATQATAAAGLKRKAQRRGGGSGVEEDGSMWVVAYSSVGVETKVCSHRAGQGGCRLHFQPRAVPRKALYNSDGLFPPQAQREGGWRCGRRPK